MKKQILEGYCEYTGDLDNDTQMINKMVAAMPADIGVQVLPEFIVLVNKKSKIAAMAEVNYELANPCDIRRVFDYWTKVYNKAGFQLGQVQPHEIHKTMSKKNKRRVTFGGHTFKIKHQNNRTFESWQDQFEDHLSSMTIDEQKELLEMLQMPDVKYPDSVMEEMLLRTPRSAQKMNEINAEKTTSFFLLKYLALHGMTATVQTEFVDPDDPSKGFMTHIKKEGSNA